MKLNLYWVDVEKIFGRFTVIKGFLAHLEDEPKNLCYGVNVSEQDGGDGGEAVLGRR